MQRILGRILSGLVIVIMLADASVNLFAPQLLEKEMNAVQFPTGLSPVLALIIVVCAAAYSLPATSFIGAILITGFFGGAISIHLRMGELLSPPQLVSLALGAAAWGGLYLRNSKLQELVFRSRDKRLLPSATKLPASDP